MTVMDNGFKVRTASNNGAQKDGLEELTIRAIHTISDTYTNEDYDFLVKIEGVYCTLKAMHMGVFLPIHTVTHIEYRVTPTQRTDVDASTNKRLHRANLEL